MFLHICNNKNRNIGLTFSVKNKRMCQVITACLQKVLTWEKKKLVKGKGICKTGITGEIMDLYTDDYNM